MMVIMASTSPASGTALRTLTLVAHASHRDGVLTKRGRYQIEQLLVGLGALGCSPSCIVSSARPQAHATAEAIAERFSLSSVCCLTELTPKTGTVGTFRTIIDELGSRVGPVDHLVLVGHEGRLSNLLTELTGGRHRPLFNGDAVMVEERQERGFEIGAGEIVARWPVAAHDEDLVREKLASKMTSTSVLAGFVLAALLAVATGVTDATADDPGPWRAASVLLLAVSVGALVGALLIYDQLSMPAGFWTDGPRPWWLKRLNDWHERRLEKRWDNGIQRGIYRRHQGRRVHARHGGRR